MAKLVLFSHSLRSDWNHGNAHFLRGVLSECRNRGMEVVGYEPAGAWSARNLAEEVGPAALEAWRSVYPDLPVAVYNPASLDLDKYVYQRDGRGGHSRNAGCLADGPRADSGQLLLHFTGQASGPCPTRESPLITQERRQSRHCGIVGQGQRTKPLAR